MGYWKLLWNFDNDLEKFKNEPKAADKGNWRRFMKNLAWFFKNPIGYTYWKSNRYISNRPIILILWGVSSLFAIHKLNNISKDHRKH